MEQVLRFEPHAFGRPYHAARVRIPARSRDTELHTHADFHEFMGVVSGSGEHLLTTGVEQLRAGDVVLVRPQDRHAVRGSAPDGLEFVNVAFPSSAWQGFLDLTRTIPAARWPQGGDRSPSTRPRRSPSSSTRWKAFRTSPALTT